jgi:hypothetical protein
MECAEFANQIVIANFEVASLILELDVLRLASQNSVFENPVSTA